MSGLHLHIDCRIEIKLNHHKKQSQTGETVSRHQIDFQIKQKPRFFFFSNFP